uniref:Uncharacterized protein n=1 Tax=Anopheles minimus TaxID=112268 RepID=A0A182WNU5_9DIPT
MLATTGNKWRPRFSSGERPVHDGRHKKYRPSFPLNGTNAFLWKSFPQHNKHTGAAVLHLAFATDAESEIGPRKPLPCRAQ